MFKQQLLRSLLVLFALLAAASAQSTSAPAGDDASALPDAPSVARAKEQDTKTASGQTTQTQTTPTAPTAAGDEHGPYKGHFLYLIPAYHVMELRDPYKRITVGEKFHVFAKDTFDQLT